MPVLIEYLESVAPEHRSIIEELDALIRAAAPDLVPSLKWRNLTYHAKRNACALVDHKEHVNLQLWGGADFVDPKSLLQGAGKGMRHIKFAIGNKFSRSDVAAIIKQAAAAARA